jgi:hypothetical protein
LILLHFKGTIYKHGVSKLIKEYTDSADNATRDHLKIYTQVPLKYEKLDIASAFSHIWEGTIRYPERNKRFLSQSQMVQKNSDLPFKYGMILDKE